MIQSFYEINVGIRILKMYRDTEVYEIMGVSLQNRQRGIF